MGVRSDGRGFGDGFPNHFRVLYDVVDEEVVLLIVGRKVGNTFVVNGAEFHEHQIDPPEPPGGGPAGDPD
jgi:hypothetical protein